MKKSIGIIAVALLMVMGCQVVDKIKYTPISEIISNSRKHENRIVTIKGTVVGIDNYLLFKSFQITDETGSITVSTKKSLPNVGETLEIKGVVKVVDLPVVGKKITIEEL